MSEVLSDDVSERIEDLCQAGDAAADAEDYQGAIGKYREAWNLIPEPQHDWEASTWVLTAIADAYILNGDHDYALEALQHAINCPNGLGNPYVHLRLGEAHFELGNLPEAADELTRAYMGGGPEIFQNEDPRYFEFLKTQIQI